MTSQDLGEGDSVLNEGTLPPHPACKGAMNRVATNTGADITYQWPGGIWMARAG